MPRRARCARAHAGAWGRREPRRRSRVGRKAEPYGSVLRQCLVCARGACIYPFPTSTRAARMSRVIASIRLHAQRISRPASTTPEAIVTHLGAVQAQDHAGALWSIGLRLAGATRADVERAIADRAIVRTWPMRGTLRFIPAADARWMLGLLEPRIMKAAAARHRQLELDDAAFRRSRAIVGRALKEEPVQSRGAIFAALEKGGVSTAGQRGIHILQRLSMERMLCYGPHAEKQPTFALFDDWIRASRQLDRDDALRTLAERYFASHGPAAPRYAGRIVPGGNGMFLSTLVLDGQVRGTWTRTARARTTVIEASPFSRLSAAQKKAFVAPAERYASFLGTSVTLTWA